MFYGVVGFGLILVGFGPIFSVGFGPIQLDLAAFLLDLTPFGWIWHHFLVGFGPIWLDLAPFSFENQD